MANVEFLVEQFGDRKICLRGIGKLFYQDGFPISLSIAELKKKGIEVALFHVADECVKHGWSAKTTYNKLVGDFEDDVYGNKYDTEVLQRFIYNTYEGQREMIFQYLFGCSTDDVRNGVNETPKQWFYNYLASHTSYK